MPFEIGRPPLLPKDVRKALTTKFDNMAMRSELPPKEIIPSIFQAAQRAAQPNPALPVKKPSDSTFLRMAKDVFGTRLTVPAKPRNQNRVNAMADPRAVISHALVTAAALKDKEPQFVANTDTCTIAMGSRIGNVLRRTRITLNEKKVSVPVYSDALLTLSPTSNPVHHFSASKSSIFNRE